MALVGAKRRRRTAPGVRLLMKRSGTIKFAGGRVAGNSDFVLGNSQPVVPTSNDD